MAVRNLQALFGFLFASLAIAILIAGGMRTKNETAVDNLSIILILIAFGISLFAVSLSRRARFNFQRTLGKVGGKKLVILARIFALFALLLSIVGGLAIAVFSILKLVA
tara:strand:+ start:282 stop:608 length:327 start_codon:yes stop_codon:yes gene_type:complete